MGDFCTTFFEYKKWKVAKSRAERGWVLKDFICWEHSKETEILNIKN